jgi:diguanylate cyclase (GGDEF)-like protein
MLMTLRRARTSGQLAEQWLALIEPLRSLPVAARCWWLMTLCLAMALAPVCLRQQTQQGLPLLGLLLAALLNGLLVVVTAPRRQRSSLVPTFDYGGIATVALLASFGPAAAQCAFFGEKFAAAILPGGSGQRPIWVRSVYNLAWGSPCIVFSWALGGLVPDRTFEPVLVALGWWLSNGLLVATMATLAQSRSARDAVWLLVSHDGWLRLQELALSVLAVVVWWTNPLLLAVVVLLVIGQAMTGRRLFTEYEQGAAAREQALAERRRAELEAEQARRDALTRLPNRRAFEERLQSQSAPQAVLMLDLDHFKHVNDTFGHDVGDMVLVAVADTLQRTLGDVAFCARLGGEEFCALIWPGFVGDSELLALAERMRHAVGALRFDADQRLHPTVSIGVARRRPDEATAREAITRADQALYRAKRDGRDRTYLEGSDALPLAG